MTFGDLIDSPRLILCTCGDCSARTPIDPSQPTLEFGRSANFDVLKESASCPVCGSADVELGAYTPVRENHREGASLAR